MDFFLLIDNIFWEQIANSDQKQPQCEKIKIELDDFRNNCKKNNLRGHFWELLDELQNGFGSVYRHFINNVYALCKDYILFLFFFE